MSKQQVALRVTDETARQLDALTEWLGATKSEVLIYAVERLYQQQVRAREEALEDAEDVRVAREILTEVRAGRLPVRRWEEFEAELDGLPD